MFLIKWFPLKMTAVLIMSGVLMLGATGCHKAVAASKTGVSSRISSGSGVSPVASAASSAPSQPQAAKRVICVDPGHQTLVDLTEEPEASGSSVMKVQNPGGAEGVVTKMPEYQLNLLVSLKVEQQLKAQGYTVVMTRETNDVNIGNIDRAKIANNCSADLFVRIHADGVDDQSVHGISILIPGSEFVTDEAIRASSKQAAQSVLDAMVAATGASDRGLSVRDDMTGFNWCTRPMMLIEMGFMSNPDEDQTMATDAYQTKLADGIVNGINDYFKAIG
jgi:N-acetylmuramoyl-L-alanine amidase